MSKISLLTKTQSKGVYSLKNGWLKEPESMDIPEVDENEISILAEPFEERANKVLENGTVEDIDKLIDDIYLERQESILKDGEFGKGNLVFKLLRSRGTLQNLKDKKVELENKEMSLEERDMEDKFNLEDIFIEEDLNEDLDNEYYPLEEGQIFELGPEHTIAIKDINDNIVHAIEIDGDEEYDFEEDYYHLQAMLFEYDAKLINDDLVVEEECKEEKIDEDVTEYEHGMEFDFPDPDDTLRVYLDWEGIFGYTDEIIEKAQEGYDALSDYLEYEGIIGYTEHIYDILNGVPAFCRDMEMEDFEAICRDEGLSPELALNEDTVKQNGKWVNKGKEGTHGKFKTKKAADAQRKAMFANGYKESLDEEVLANTDVSLDLIKSMKLGDRFKVRPTEKHLKERGLSDDSPFEFVRFEDGWHTFDEGKDLEMSPLDDEDLFRSINNLNGEGYFTYEPVINESKPQLPKEIGSKYDWPYENDNEPRTLPPNADDNDYIEDPDEYNKFIGRVNEARLTGEEGLLSKVYKWCEDHNFEKINDNEYKLELNGSSMRVMVDPEAGTVVAETIDGETSEIATRKISYKVDGYSYINGDKYKAYPITDMLKMSYKYVFETPLLNNHPIDDLNPELYKPMGHDSYDSGYVHEPEVESLNEEVEYLDKVKVILDQDGDRAYEQDSNILDDKYGFYQSEIIFEDDMSQEKLKELGIGPGDKFIVGIREATPEEEDAYGDTVMVDILSKVVDESLNEAIEDDPKARALAEFEDVDVSEITQDNPYDPNYYSIGNSLDYLVCTDEEATEEAVNEIKSLYDDLGIDSFTPRFQEWILDNAVEDDIIDEFVDNEIEYFTNDEPDQNMVDYLEGLTDRTQYVIDTLGKDEFKELVKDHIDLDKVAEEAISEDGRGHFLSMYDGQEIDLGNGLFAYRIN